MKALKVERFGDNCQGVELRGDRRNPEPEYFRVIFPGGDLDIVRTSDDQYWVHIRVNRPEDLHSIEDRKVGRMVDARLDIATMHTSDVNVGDFKHPELYHLAVRVAPGEIRAAVPAPKKQIDLFDAAAPAAEVS